jgi:hypothetical protein
MNRNFMALAVLLLALLVGGLAIEALSDRNLLRVNAAPALQQTDPTRTSVPTSGVVPGQPGATPAPERSDGEGPGDTNDLDDVPAAPGQPGATPAPERSDGEGPGDTNDLDDVPAAPGQVPAPAPQQPDTDDRPGDTTDDDSNDAPSQQQSDPDGPGDATDDDSNGAPSQLPVTPEQARAVAESANPGAKALDIAIDQVNESGGAFIYEVELDNGVDVAVDASTGKILGSED